MPGRTEEQLRELYPVAEVFTPLDGFDIKRTPRRIIALVAVEEEKGGRDLRLYSWVKRPNKNYTGPQDSGNTAPEYVWKVDYARMSTTDWNFREIATQAKKLAAKYNVKMNSL